MSDFLPRSRPSLTEEEARALLAKHSTAPPADKVVLLGIRGYYRDSMGKPGANDRAMYDDALVLIAPGAYQTFNGNTDPSAWRNRIATLVPGTWRYKIGTHGLSKPPARRYKALVQADEVRVRRDSAGSETGWFGINVHKGGNGGTSSLGCQTIPPAQWPAFIKAVEAALKAAGQKTLAYVLIDGPVK